MYIYKHLKNSSYYTEVMLNRLSDAFYRSEIFAFIIEIFFWSINFD